MYFIMVPTRVRIRNDRILLNRREILIHFEDCEFLVPYLGIDFWSINVAGSTRLTTNNNYRARRLDKLELRLF